MAERRAEPDPPGNVTTVAVGVAAGPQDVAVVDPDYRPGYGPSREAAAGGELGSVVLRREGKTGRGLLPLRPLGIALLLLVILDGVLRLTLPADARVLRDPLHPYGCFREDDLDHLTQARMTQTRQTAGAGPQIFGGWDVVLLGDSVLSATNNPQGERVEDYLGPALQQRLGGPVRVWNLGRGGSHAADLYAALHELAAAVPGIVGSGGQGGMAGLFVVLDTNMIFFSRRQASPAMLYPCLLDGLPAATDAWNNNANDDLPALRSLLRLPAGPGAGERSLTSFVTRTFYLYQQRRRIDELLFGGPPRDALRERLLSLLSRLHLRSGQVEVADPNLPWSRRGLSAAQFRGNYERLPFSSPEAINYRVSLRLAALLAGMQKDLPSFVFMTPQNHGLLGELADNPGYRTDAAAVGRIFTTAGVPYRSYDGLLEDGLFTDLDHLTAAGNRRLAALLADDLAPRIVARARAVQQGQPQQ